MSNNSRQNRVLVQPHQSIGSQDLLKVGSRTHCGFLRKRGKLERIRDSLKFLRPILGFKWRQKFVILSQGCMYIYADEFSQRALNATSLRGYSKLSRLANPNLLGRMNWCFEVIPEDPINMKTFAFSCANEEDRIRWMSEIKEEMLSANDSPESRKPDDCSDEYMYLERQISNVVPPETKKINEARKKNKNRRLPDTPNGNQSPINEDETKPNYDEIGEVNDLRKKKDKKPKPAPRPKQERSLSEEEYEYKGDDRTQVDTLLKNRQEGTFLVRNSRQGNSQVLSVKTGEGMKEYKIFKHESKPEVSLDKQTYFSSTLELVGHYTKNSLPRRSMSLGKAYSQSDIRF
ncbi:hypothetical protein ScPMuIL_000359 [Solemya velum]